MHHASNQRQHEDEFFSMNGEVQDKLGADDAAMRSARRAGEEIKFEPATQQRVPANLEVTRSNLAANISADISAIQIPQRAPQENSMQMSSMMLDQSALSMNPKVQGQNIVTLPLNLLGGGENVASLSMQERVDMRRTNAQSAKAGPKKIQPQIV